MKKWATVIIGTIILLPSCILADEYRLTVTLEHFTDPNSSTIDMSKVWPGGPGVQADNSQRGVQANNSQRYEIVWPAPKRVDPFKTLKSTKQIFRQTIQVKLGNPIDHLIEIGDVSIKTTGHIGKFSGNKCPVQLSIQYKKEVRDTKTRTPGYMIQSTAGIYQCAIGQRLLTSGVARLVDANELIGFTLKLETIKKGFSSGPKRAGEFSAELRAIQQRLQAEEAQTTSPSK
jgi:hypothetical protein